MRRFRELYTLVSAILLGACANIQPVQYEYSQDKQPVFIEYGANFYDGTLQERLKYTLASYGIQTTENRTQAQTTINLSKTQINSEKSIKNNLANNNSIFYQTTLSTELDISAGADKPCHYHQRIQAKTPMIVLENQNIFSSDMAGSTLYQELQITLIERILAQLEQVNLRTSSKKTI